MKTSTRRTLIIVGVIVLVILAFVLAYELTRPTEIVFSGAEGSFESLLANGQIQAIYIEGNYTVKIKKTGDSAFKYFVNIDSRVAFSDKLKEYFYFMDSVNTKSIYITGLVNKTYLLSIGQVEVLKNGSLKYSEGSRSLGNYTSKENRGWLNELKPMAEKSLINPRESKPIATIIDYYDYKVLSKKYREVSQSSDNVISELVKMRVYMKEIKNEFPNILYNNK